LQSKQPIKLEHQDEHNHYYDFLTNNFDIPAEEVAFLYKKRWGLELLFKNSFCAAHRVSQILQIRAEINEFIFYRLNNYYCF
jgi:IS4 transposase